MGRWVKPIMTAAFKQQPKLNIMRINLCKSDGHRNRAISLCSDQILNHLCGLIMENNFSCMKSLIVCLAYKLEMFGWKMREVKFVHCVVGFVHLNVNLFSGLWKHFAIVEAMSTETILEKSWRFWVGLTGNEKFHIFSFFFRQTSGKMVSCSLGEFFNFFLETSFLSIRKRQKPSYFLAKTFPPGKTFVSM